MRFDTEVTVSRQSVKPDVPEQAAVAGLDPLLGHKSRLGAMVLISGAELTFSRLKVLLDETDGNLGAQLRKLEEAGYVSVRKEFVDRKPVSWYGLSATGKKALRAHLKAMEELIAMAR